MRVLIVSLIVALAQGGFLQQQDPSLADQELERIQTEENLGHPELQTSETSGADEERLSWDEGDEKIEEDREEEEYSFVQTAKEEPKVQEEEDDDEDGPFDGSDMEDINPPADSFLQTDDVTDDVDVEDTKDELDDSETSLEADDEDGNDEMDDSEDSDSTDETTDEAEDETIDSTDKASDEAEEKQEEAKILLSVEEEEAEEFQVPSKQCSVCTKGLWAKEVPTIKACMRDQGSTGSKAIKAKAHQKIRHACGVEARMRVHKSKQCDSQCASVKHIAPTCKTCVVSLWKTQGAPDFRKKVKVCKDVKCKREVAKEAHLKMRALAKAQCKKQCGVSALISVETEDFEEEALEAAGEAKPVKKEVKKVAKKEEKKAEIKYDKKKFAKDWHKEWKHGDVPSYKETYSKDTFPGRKAVVAAEDSQSDGKPGPAGLTGPVGAHLKHSADGAITR